MKLLTKRERIRERLEKLGVNADKVFLFADQHSALVAMEVIPSTVLVITAEDWQLRAYPNGKPSQGKYAWKVFGSGPASSLEEVLMS